MGILFSWEDGSFVSNFKTDMIKDKIGGAKKKRRVESVMLDGEKPKGEILFGEKKKDGRKISNGLEIESKNGVKR